MQQHRRFSRSRRRAHRPRRDQHRCRRQLRARRTRGLRRNLLPERSTARRHHDARDQCHETFNAVTCALKEPQIVDAKKSLTYE